MRAELERNFRERGEIGPAVAAYSRDEKVAEGRALRPVEAIDLRSTWRCALVVRGSQIRLTNTAEHEVVRSPASVTAPVHASTLRVLALGKLEVVVDGAPVPPKSWGYAKARELLVYLLMHPEGRTREQVGAALSPEASAAQVRNSFHVTLHHLRRALGRAE